MGSGHMGWRGEEAIVDLGTVKPNGDYEQGGSGGQGGWDGRLGSALKVELTWLVGDVGCKKKRKKEYVSPADALWCQLLREGCWGKEQSHGRRNLCLWMSEACLTSKPSEGVWLHPHLDFSLLASRTVREWIAVVLSSLGHLRGCPRRWIPSPSLPAKSHHPGEETDVQTGKHLLWKSAQLGHCQWLSILPG